MYVFDLDGTLVDSVNAHIAAWIDATRQFGIEKTVEEIKPLLGLPAAEIAKSLLPTRHTELAALKNKIFLEKYLPLVKPYDDAVVLKRIPRPIAVVTSSSGHVAREILKSTNLHIYVDLVLGGDEVPRGKPAPDPLYRVAEYFSISPREIAVVGDTEYDMEMARQAGAVGICIQRDDKSRCKKADAVIKSLYELLLRQL